MISVLVTYIGYPRITRMLELGEDSEEAKSHPEEVLIALEQSIAYHVLRISYTTCSTWMMCQTLSVFVVSSAIFTSAWIPILHVSVKDIVGEVELLSGYL